MNADDDRALQKAIDLAQRQPLYRIYYRKDNITDVRPDVYSQKDAAVWVAHLNRTEGPFGYEYWAEEAEPPLRTNT